MVSTTTGPELPSGCFVDKQCHVGRDTILGKAMESCGRHSSHVEYEGERQCDSRHTASTSRQAVSYRTEGICRFCSNDKRCGRSTTNVVSTVCVPIKGTTRFLFSYTLQNKSALAPLAIPLFCHCLHDVGCVEQLLLLLLLLVVVVVANRPPGHRTTIVTAHAPQSGGLIWFASAIALLCIRSTTR